MPKLRIDVLIELLEIHNKKLYELYTLCKSNDISDKLLTLINTMDAILEKLEDVNIIEFVLQDPPPANNL